VTKKSVHSEKYHNLVGIIPEFTYKGDVKNLVPNFSISFIKKKAKT